MLNETLSQSRNSSDLFFVFYFIRYLHFVSSALKKHVIPTVYLTSDINQKSSQQNTQVICG